MPSSRKNVMSLSLSLSSCSFCSCIILSINSWCLFSDLSSMAMCSWWILISWSCTYSLFFCFFCFFLFEFSVWGWTSWSPSSTSSETSSKLFKFPEKDKKLQVVLIKNLVFKDSYLVKKQMEDWGFIPKLNTLPKLTGPKNFKKSP